MAEAPRDQNHVPTALFESSTAPGVTFPGRIDQNTGRILVDSAGGGSGTVTTVSVVTANGFAGTVANPTTTPAITISTTITGIIKGNGTAISAATAGTDYTNLAFKTIAVSGQSDIVADSAEDTLTFAAGSNITITTNAGTDTITIAASGSTGVSSVTGTTNRITVNNTDPANPVVDIAATYVGQTSITTLGTIATGTWAGTTVAVAHGGTGVTTIAAKSIWLANSLDTITSVTPGASQSIRINSGNTAWEAYTPTTGTVTSVSGTTNRITSTGGATPVIDISASYVGQSSITTLGTITTGVWNGTTIAIANGGTGATTLAGASIPTYTSTNTFTNKRITRRVVTTTQSATPTINTDNTDMASITGLAQAITSMTTNLSGTPVQGDFLEIQITDNGTARAITWGASFVASTVALPTTTVISTLLHVLFEWDSTSSKWICVAVA